MRLDPQWTPGTYYRRGNQAWLYGRLYRATANHKSDVFGNDQLNEHYWERIA